MQKVLSHLVHGFAGEIVDCSGPDGVTAATNVSNNSSDRGNNASGGSGTNGGEFGHLSLLFEN